MTSTHAAQDAPFPLGPMRGLSRALEKVEGAVLVVVLLTMVTLAFAQVLLRQIREHYPVFQPVPWFGPFTQHLVVWVGIIGAAIATREGRHFGVEALTKSFGVRGRRRLDLALQTVSCLFTAAVAVLAWNHLLLRELKAVSPVFEIDSLHLKVWRWQLLAVVPVELTVMVYRFGLRALEALLLGDETWDEHDKSLRPELEQASVDVAPEPPSDSSGPAAPPAPPPPAPPPPDPDPPPAEPPPSPPDPAPPATSERKKPNTEEVRVYRIADTGDVAEPEPRPGEPPPPDDDASLVDSESVEADDPLTDNRDAGATTQRSEPEGRPEDGGAA